MSAESCWLDLYQQVPLLLPRFREIEGVLSAFNTNIDAVVKVRGDRIAEVARDLGMDPGEITAEGPRRIETPRDLVRGLVRCFAGGIAEEWIVQREEVSRWAGDAFGEGRLQMGGQAGIVANALAFLGVQRVLVHCAALPEVQASLLLDLPGLLAPDAEGRLRPARTVVRDDPPMVHRILEFDSGDVLPLPGNRIVCPKSNRFIATFDPFNLEMRLDPRLAEAAAAIPLELVFLSGYHLLQDPLPGGRPAREAIAASIRVFEEVRRVRPGVLVHLEAASTQDRRVREQVLAEVVPRVDSLGLNERELIDLLEVCDPALAARCDADPHGATLFEGLRALHRHAGVPRIQLHFFGCYATLQARSFRCSPEANRLGMLAAAALAAGKAATGSLEHPEALDYVRGRGPSDVGIREMASLAGALGLEGIPAREFLESGIQRGDEFDVVAVPTVLVERPVSLVGMGDTISSISLVGALAAGKTVR